MLKIQTLSSIRINHVLNAKLLVIKDHQIVFNEETLQDFFFFQNILIVTAIVFLWRYSQYTETDLS